MTYSSDVVQSSFQPVRVSVWGIIRTINFPSIRLHPDCRHISPGHYTFIFAGGTQVADGGGAKKTRQNTKILPFQITDYSLLVKIFKAMWGNKSKAWRQLVMVISTMWFFVILTTHLKRSLFKIGIKSQNTHLIIIIMQMGADRKETHFKSTFNQLLQIRNNWNHSVDPSSVQLNSRYVFLHLIPTNFTAASVQQTFKPACKL